MSVDPGQPAPATERPASAYVWPTMQILLLVAGMWYWLQIVHECGHVLGAWVTGGRVQAVVLEFFGFSRTDVYPNQNPLVVVWAGPLVGVAIPTLVWAGARLCRPTVAPMFGFFAGMCLVGNGSYIGFGSIDGIGDAGEMLRHGTPAWALWTIGAAMVATGFWL